jgi:hypothetical protein
MKNNILLLIFLFLFFSNANSQEKDIFNYPNSVRFANYLYSNSEYSLAIQEYKRVLFIDSSNVLANKKIHDSFIRLGSYTEGLKFSDEIIQKSVLNDTLLILRGKLMLLTGNFSRLNKEVLNKPISSDGFLYLKMSESVFQKDWKMATAFLPEIENNVNLQQFATVLHRTEGVNYKSPGLSIAMSALVPGSGKAYSGYWKDGLISFLFVGITAWQSYRGFSDKGIKSAYGWIMGGISLSFYTGNLYGSVKAANKKNHEMDQSILNEFEEVFIPAYSSF